MIAGGELYTITTSQPTSSSSFAALATSPWHERLGHPGAPVFDSLRLNKFIQCTGTRRLSVCDSCSLSKHVRLPFANSTSRMFMPFDIVHCDLWTSPILSSSGHKYYLLLLDDYSNFLCTFPLSNKRQTLSSFLVFRNFIRTQFEHDIKNIECYN